MKNIFLLLFLVISTSAFAQETIVAVPPPDTAEDKWLKDNADQPYLSLANEYETVINPDWSYEETYHARVKIQKDEARELGQWPVYYNDARDKITEIKAHVETADGRIVPATNIQDAVVYGDFPMYADMRMKVVNLPDVSVGAIIDVTVKSKTKTKEIPSQYWTEILYPPLPTKHASHTFMFPEDKNIQFKPYKSKFEPAIEKSGGIVKYTFNFDQTSPIPDSEEFMPPLQEELGGLYLSSIPDWKVVADWYRELVKKSIVSNVDVTMKALELTKDKTTQKDMARSVLEFIQDNFRPVNLNFGDNPVAPHESKEIFKSRYGDSKDIAILAKQMLRLAGVESKICLLSTEFAGNPQAGLPSPSVFIRVILQMNLDGQDYYVDPQLKGFDFGQFPSTYDNAYVFVIGENDYKFDHLPIGSEADHTLSSKADIIVHSDGFAEFRVHVKLPVEASQSFKQTWKTASDEEKDKFFTNLEQNFTKGGHMVSNKVTGVDNRYGIVEFDLKYEAPTAYPLVNDMILIKEEDQSDIPAFSKETRQYPIFVPNNSIIQNSNTYFLPDGFKATYIPSNYSVSSDFMNITVDYTAQDNNSVKVDSLYQTKRVEIPVDQYPQIRSFRQDTIKKNNQYIVLKKPVEAAPAPVTPEVKDAVKTP